MGSIIASVRIGLLVAKLDLFPSHDTSSYIDLVGLMRRIDVPDPSRERSKNQQPVLKREQSPDGTFTQTQKSTDNNDSRASGSLRTQ